MKPRADFATMIAELLELPDVSFNSLAHECQCTETHIRNIAKGDKVGKPHKRVVPSYDIGAVLVRKYREAFDKPEPRLW